MSVKPTFIQSFEEEVLMEPFICQWVNNPSMLTMHLFQPLLVVQIGNLKFEPVHHIFNADISDGIHYIPVIVDVDSQCQVDFAFEDVDVCDFIVVKESVGHPATFDFRLVRILNNCFNCLKVIIDGQYQPRGARCIPSLHDHPTNFNTKNSHQRAPKCPTGSGKWFRHSISYPLI